MTHAKEGDNPRELPGPKWEPHGTEVQLENPGPPSRCSETAAGSTAPGAAWRARLTLLSPGKELSHASNFLWRANRPEFPVGPSPS